MSIKRKFNRNFFHNNNLLNKLPIATGVLGTILTIGFAVNPAYVEAEIVKVNGNQAFLGEGQNKADIYADAILKDQVGLNTFKKFDVDAGKIANMYFQKEQGGTWVNNLVNIVGSKINVNGTVNAVQNSKIGGNLFFMSSDGMVVGKSGVINAGTLNVMTPHNKYFVEAGLAKWTDETVENGVNGAIDLINWAGGNLSPTDIEAFQDGFMKNNWGKIQQLDVPVNKAGTITILGRVNTVEGIKMKAVNINVGDATPGELGNAVLQTGVTNFTDLVNTGTANAGLAGDLTAVQNQSGDIELVASADMVNYQNENYKNPLAKNAWGDNTIRAQVNIGQNAQVKAVGDIAISAEATNGASQRALFDPGLYEQFLANASYGDLLGSSARTEAIINVNGAVTADTFTSADGEVAGGHLNIQATAENNFAPGEFTDPASMTKDLVKGFIPLDSDISYVNIESLAEVNVGQEASLTGNSAEALGEDADGNITGSVLINANSSMEASAGSGAAAVLLGKKKLGSPLPEYNPDGPINVIGQYIPNFGVTYMETDNQANVNIAGDISSQGGTSITATAESQVEATAAADAPPRTAGAGDTSGTNFVNAAINYAEFNNQAGVNITGGKQTAAGDVEINASAAQEATTGAAVNASETSMANTAINMTYINGGANVNVGSEIQGDNINITANNEISQEITANNAAGLSKMGAKRTVSDGGNGSLNVMNNLFGSMKLDKLGASEQIGQFMTVGASVAYVDEQNTANVIVKKNAQLIGTGDVALDAANRMYGSYIEATAGVNNHRKDTNTQTMMSGAVVYSDTENTANVLVEGSDNVQDAARIKGRNVSAKASSKFEWGRLEILKGNLEECLDLAKEAYATDMEIINKIKEAYAAMTALDINDPDTAVALSSAVQEVIDQINLSNVQANMEGINSLLSIPSQLKGFADLTAWTNFHTSASTSGKTSGTGGGSGQGSGGAQLAVAGAVNMNTVNNDAQVVIGKQAQVTAAEKLQLTARALQEDVTMNAKVKYIIPKTTNAGGAAGAAGGTYGQHDANISSRVIVAEAAQLRADTIDLHTDNKVKRTIITFGGANGGTAGVSGMVTNTQGSSDSMVVVDDDAVLQAADAVKLHADNDTIISMAVGDRTKGGVAVGAAVGLVDYDVNNIAGVTNLHGDAQKIADLQALAASYQEQAQEAYDAGNDEERIRLEKLWYSTLDQLRLLEAMDQANIGGITAEGIGKGSITADSLSVQAATTGIINNATVAGVTSQSGTRGNGGGSNTKSNMKLAGAGSSSANDLSGNTAAMVENITVNLGAAGRLAVEATDAVMNGAYTGAAALKKNGLGSGSSSGGFSATLAGAVALVEDNRAVTAQLKDTEINNLKSLSNTASKSGADVAAGLALGSAGGAVAGGGGNATGLGLGVSASLNESNTRVQANIENSKIHAAATKAEVINQAMGKDIQIAGGINFQKMSGNLGLGVAVSMLDVNNTIQAGISGGVLENIGKLENQAVSDLTQVGTAVSAGIIKGQSAFGVQGAYTENNVTNNVIASVEGGAEISADQVEIKAYDGTLPFNEFKNILADQGFDVDGEDAMADVNAGNGDVNTNKNKIGDDTAQREDVYQKQEFKADENGGNLIITSSAGLALNSAGQTGVAAGTAIANTNIANSFATVVKDAKITADGGLNIKAESDTLMVNVSGGAAASKATQGLVATGSVALANMANKTTATVENSTLSAVQTSLDAQTTSRMIAVAGQISATKGNAALGVATATNNLNNTTGAYAYGTSLTSEQIIINAENDSRNYAIAAGLSAATGTQGAALNGSVALNNGSNATEAIVDAYEDQQSSIKDVASVEVSTLDNTVLKTIAGGVTYSGGNAALGGAVAQSSIGTEAAKQSNRASINNATISLQETGRLKVEALDTADMLTIAAGLVAQTGQGGAAQGSVAVANIDKNTEASLNRVDITNGTVDVSADSTSDVTTSADAAGLSTSYAAGGVAVAVTNSSADTKALVNGGVHRVNDEIIKATSRSSLLNVGIGMAVTTGQGGSAAGNVAVNNITNNTQAKVSGATIETQGNVGVIADSYEHLQNYTGAASVTAGQGYVAGGVSVAVNSITGDTSALVENAEIAAQGKTVDGITLGGAYGRPATTYQGLVVDAASRHELDNVVVTAGMAVTSTAGVAAAGTVNVNTVSGATAAQVNNTEINATTAPAGDVNVAANDKTDISTHAATVAVGIGASGGGGAAGEASDTTLLERRVNAKVGGGFADKAIVNAKQFNVQAQQRNSILTTASGVAAGGGMYGGAGVAGTVSVVNDKSETKAEVEWITSTNEGITVDAQSSKQIDLFGNSAAVSAGLGSGSVGLGVAVLSDESRTVAGLNASDIKHRTAGAVDKVHAVNNTTVLSELANAALAVSIGGAISGVVSVNNHNNVVEANINNTKLGTEGVRAEQLDVRAENNLDNTYAAATGAGGSILGVGTGVTVNNIHSAAIVNANGSNLQARDVQLQAYEKRDIAQHSVSTALGIVGVPVNVQVTNIGAALGSEFGQITVDAHDADHSQETIGTKVNIQQAINDAGTAVRDQQSLVNSENTAGVIGGEQGNSPVDASYGVKVDSGLQADSLKSGLSGSVVEPAAGANEGVKVNVNLTEITADEAKVYADAETNAKLGGYGGAVAGVSIRSNAAVLNVERKGGINFDQSNIKAQNITVTSNQGGLSQINSYQGAVGSASLNITYGGVKLTGSNDINIIGSQLQAEKDLQVSTSDHSRAKVDVVSVDAGGLVAGVIVTEAKNKSSSTITVANDRYGAASSLTAGNDLKVMARHGVSEALLQEAEQAYNKVYADAQNGVLGRAEHAYRDAQSAYQQAQGEEKGEAADKLEEARLKLEKVQGEVRQAAEKARIEYLTKTRDEAGLYINLVPVGVGVAAGMGVNGQLVDTSSTAVNIQGSGNSFSAGNLLDIQASNNSVNNAQSVATTGGGASAGLSGVEARADLKSSLQISDDNSFVGHTINLGADANAMNRADVVSVGGAYFGSFNVNWAQTSADNNVNVTVGNNRYNTLEKKVTIDGNGDKSYTEQGSLNIQGKSNIQQQANIIGVNVGYLFASGTNMAILYADNDVQVSVGGNTLVNQNDKVAKANIKAVGKVSQFADSNGYGGAMADISPVAAWVDNSVGSKEDTTRAQVTLSGDWNVGDLQVDALQDNYVNLLADAVKASIVGLSGVYNYNNIWSNTGIVLDGAHIQTSGDVDLNARNAIGYRNRTWGGGYGVAQGAAVFAHDDISLHNDVTIKNNSKVSAEGSIDINAVNGDSYYDPIYRAKTKLNKDVVLKSAGVVANTFVQSDDDISLQNTINLEQGSELQTRGINSDNPAANDINLIAADRLEFANEATADTQGGLVGAAFTKVDNRINQSNSITIGGKINSNYDTLLDAGRTNRLDVVLKSNAYNMTGVPLATKPTLKTAINQSNKVNILSTGALETTRNINLAATSGDATIVKQSEEKRIWGGTQGNAQGATTLDGSQTSIGTADNGISIEGKLTAGNNSKLDMTITMTEEQKQAFNAILKKYFNDEIGFGTISSELEDASKAYFDKLAEKDATRKELAEKEAKLANDLAMQKEISNEKNNINDKLYWAGTKVTSTKNKLDTAKTNAGTSWDGNADTRIAYGEKHLTNGATSSDYQDKAKADYLKTSGASEDLWNGFSNADKYSYYKAYFDETSAKNEYIANTVANEQKAYDEAVADRNRWNSRYNDKQKEYNSYNEIKALQESIKKLTKEIEAFENSVEVKRLEAKYNEAKQAHDDALANGFDKQDMLNYIFGANGEKQGDYVTVQYGQDSQWFVDKYGKDAVKVGIFDYALHLTDSLKQLAQMMREYAGTAVGKEYETQMRRVQGELQALGLGYTNEHGEFMISEGGSETPTVEIHDIMVSGGNVSMTTDAGKVQGHGQIKAIGAPMVNISNSSDFYLKVNDIIVGSEGGNVLLNEKTFAPQGTNITVQDEPNQTMNTKAGISIQASGGLTSNEQYFIPDIGIFGKLENPFGKITIKNEKNSIYIKGDTIENMGDTTSLNGKKDSGSGSINGREVEIIAGGAVTQGYQDGIVNVGGNPHYLVDEATVKMIQRILVDALGDNKDIPNKYYVAFADEDALTDFIWKKTTYEECDSIAKARLIARELLGSESDSNKQKGIFASGGIYINAANINVNGTMQSGYADFKLRVNEGKLNSLKSSVPGDVRPDSEFMNDKYLVSEGNGAHYNTADRIYDYNIRAWYNPTTDTVFTEAIDQSKGGRIVLEGVIASTGGGKLVALNGGGRYDINTQHGHDDYRLKVNSINAEPIKGVIQINDKNRGSYDANGNYNPEKGQRYKWTTGESSRVVTSYEHVTDSSWWGLSEDEWLNQLSKVDKANPSEDLKFTVTNEPGKQASRDDVIGRAECEGNNAYQHIDIAGSGTNAKDSGDYIITMERKGKPIQSKNNDQQLLYNVKDSSGNYLKDDAGNIIRVTKEEYHGSGTLVPHYQRDNNGNIMYEVEISPREVTTESKGLLGLWGKKITTKWTETKGMLTTYNYSVKADKQIEIDYIGQNGSRIDIGNNQNVLINGNIHGDKITIKSDHGNIDSTNFGQVFSGAKAYTDDLALQAGGNIQLAQHGRLGNLSLTVNQTGGNVNLNTYAGTDKQGNLNGDIQINHIQADGRVRLSTEGSINGRQESFDIQANGVELNSMGAIGSADNRLIIKAVGDERIDAVAENDIYLYHADKDVYYNQDNDKLNPLDNNKDNDSFDVMHLGRIESKNGNVNLMSYDGFVDAVENNAIDSVSDVEKLAGWKRLGLLGDASVAEQMKNDMQTQLDNLLRGAASVDQGFDFKAEGERLRTDVASEYNAYYAARQDMLQKELAVQRAFKAMSQDYSDSNKAVHEAAKKEYNTAVGIYADKQQAYQQAKSNWLSNNVPNIDDAGELHNQQKMSNLLSAYEELTHRAPGQEDNYGWTKRQLLYAVKDSIINPDAGAITDVRTPNITAKNITLLTDNGDIGKVDQATTIINIQDMFDESNTAIEKDLKKLAKAHADDVTWTEDQLIINNSEPISTKLTDPNGQLNIKAPESDHVLIIGKEGQLNIDQIISGGEVRLLGQNGIQSIDPNKSAVVIGSKITLEGGTGDIGNSEHNLQIGLLDGGKVNANTSKNIYLEQLTETEAHLGDHRLNKDLIVGSIAGEEIYLSNKNTITAGGTTIVRNIISGADEQSGGTEANISYINAGKKLVINTEGSVGEAHSGLRVKNSGATVEIYGSDNAYLEGIKEGELVLKQINTEGELHVNSAGSVLVGREDDPNTPEDESVSNAAIAGEDISIFAKDDIVLNGNVTQRDANQHLDLSSTAGNIIQKAAADGTVGIHADKVLLAAYQGRVDLQDADNNISQLEIGSLGSSMDVKTSSDNMNMKFDYVVNHYGGDINIENLTGSLTTDSGSRAYLKGNLGLQSKENIINTAEWYVDDNINLEAQQLVRNEGVLEAQKDVKINAGTDAVLRSNVTAGQDIIVNSAQNTELNGVVAATRDIQLEAQNNISIHDRVDAGRDIKAVAADDVLVNGIVDALGSYTLAAGNEVQLDGLNRAAADFNLVGAQKAVLRGKVAAGQNLNLKAGEMSLEGNFEANNGSLTVSADNASLSSFATLYAKQGADLNVSKRLELSGDFLTEGQLQAAAEEALLSGSVTAQQGIALETRENTMVNGNVTTLGDLVVKVYDAASTNGSLVLKGYLNAKNIQAVAKHGLTTEGQLQASDSISLKSGRDMLLQGQQDAQNSIAAVAGGGLTVGNDITSRAGKVSLKAVGDVKVAGLVNAAADMELLSGEGQVNVSRELQAGGSLRATAVQGALSISSGLAATADVALQGTSIAVDAVNAGKNIQLTTDGQLSANGSLQAGQDLTVRADGLNVGFGLTAGRSVDVVAKGNTLVRGLISAEDEAKLYTAGNLNLSNGIKGQQVDVFAGGLMTMNGNNEAREHMQLRAGGNATLNGRYTTSTGALNVAAGGMLTTNGSMKSAQNMELLAVGNANLKGSINAGQGLDVQSNANANISSTITAKNIDVKAATSARLTGNTRAAGGKVEVSSGGRVSLGRRVVGQKVIKANNRAVGAELKAAADHYRAEVNALKGDINAGLLNNTSLRNSADYSSTGSLNSFLGVAPEAVVDLDLLEVLSLDNAITAGRVDLHEVNVDYVALVGAPAAEDELSVVGLVNFLKAHNLLSDDNLLLQLAMLDYAEYTTKVVAARFDEDYAPQADGSKTYEV